MIRRALFTTFVSSLCLIFSAQADSFWTNVTDLPDPFPTHIPPVGEFLSKPGDSFLSTINSPFEATVYLSGSALTVISRPLNEGGRFILAGPLQVADAFTKAAGDLARNVPREINQGVGDLLTNAPRQLGRDYANFTTALVAASRYPGRFLESSRQSLIELNTRLQEGKILDGVWHWGISPLQNLDDDNAKLMQESEILRTIATVAASAYGGPQGSAAFAAWYTYKTTGDAELALKIGVITGASNAALSGVSKIPVSGQADIAGKSIAAAAIGGLTVALSGGDEEAVRKGALLSGTMVFVQSEYKEITTHDYSGKSSVGEGYDKENVLRESDPHAIPYKAYVRDGGGNIQFKEGKPVFEFKALDPSRPEVGQWGPSGNPSMAQECSRFMTGVSRIPGMNGMAVLHDQLMINWEALKGAPVSTTLNVSTIPLAIYVTYVGSGAPFTDMVQQIASTSMKANDASNGERKTVQVPSINQEFHRDLVEALWQKAVADKATRALKLKYAAANLNDEQIAEMVRSDGAAYRAGKSPDEFEAELRKFWETYKQIRDQDGSPLPVAK